MILKKFDDILKKYKFIKILLLFIYEEIYNTAFFNYI